MRSDLVTILVPTENKSLLLREAPAPPLFLVSTEKAPPSLRFRTDLRVEKGRAAPTTKWLDRGAGAPGPQKTHPIGEKLTSNRLAK